MNDFVDPNSQPKIAASELTWPIDWSRTPAARRDRSRYEVTQDQAVDGIRRAVKILKGSNLVISTNLPLNRYGRPSNDAREPKDPGVAVYWTRNNKPQVIACDKYSTVRENLRAVGLALDALRALERSGASQVIERAFMGLRALSANAERHWRLVLELPDVVDEPTIDAAYRRLAKVRHPDKQSGSLTDMIELNRAHRQALEELRRGL